jgi:hypothetical protein
VKHVDDGIAAARVDLVARRKVDGDIAIGRVSFEISFERSAVDLDPFDCTVARRFALAEKACRWDAN